MLKAAVTIGSMALACVASVTGCASSPSVPPSARPAGHQLPQLAVGLLTNTRSALGWEARLNNEVESLIQRCMAAQHLRFIPNIEHVTTDDYLAGSLPEYPEYTDLAARQADGYGLYKSFIQERSRTAGGTPSGANTEARYILHMSTQQQSRYNSVLKGSPSNQVPVSYPDGVRGGALAGGCIGRAERAVYGSVPDYSEATTGLSMIRIDFVDNVESTGTFTKIVNSWSRCMTMSNYHYASPSRADEELAALYTSYGRKQALRHREIAVAIADYRCANAVSLRARTLALQTLAMAHLLAAYRRDLLSYAAIYRQALRSSRDALQQPWRDNINVPVG